MMCVRPAQFLEGQGPPAGTTPPVPDRMQAATPYWLEYVRHVLARELHLDEPQRGARVLQPHRRLRHFLFERLYCALHFARRILVRQRSETQDMVGPVDVVLQYVFAGLQEDVAHLSGTAERDLAFLADFQGLVRAGHHHGASIFRPRAGLHAAMIVLSGKRSQVATGQQQGSHCEGG